MKRGGNQGRVQEKTRARLGLCFQGVYSLGDGMGYAEDEPAAAGNKSISDEGCAALVPLEVSMQFLGRILKDIFTQVPMHH